MAGKTTSRTTNTDTKLVKELAKILNDTDLSEIEIEKGDLKIRVARNIGTLMTAAVAPAQAPAAAIAPAALATSEGPADSAEDLSSHPGAVKSPMVGTAYIRPSPDADPFTKVGDTVKEGDTVLLVEAMKTFNAIVAPKSGKITHILIEDAQPVEFGEALFVIE